MSLAAELRTRLAGTVVVVGIGNPMKGDDGAGSLAVRRLAACWDGTAIDAEDAPERVLGAVAAARPDVVLLIDAVEMGAEPGSLALLSPEDLGRYWPSTHRVPVALLMEYLHRTTGADVLLLAVQPGGAVGLLCPISRAVSEGVSIAVEMLAAAPGRYRPGVAGNESAIAAERFQC